jgi:Domain of unknown function (DUF4411)
MAYLLDADVFIQAKNLHYGLDFCPAFWDWLIAVNIKCITPFEMLRHERARFILGPPP